MKLSNNLSLAEVVKSNTATRLGIENNPNQAALENLTELAERVFQPLRDHFNVPIGVSSGYRSIGLNAVIGGSRTSSHCKGEALDLDADIHGRITNAEIFNFIKDNLEFDQLIWDYGTLDEPSWVHVSYRKEGNRKEVLRAIKVNGRTVYQTL